MDHSHLAVDVDLIGQLNKVETALGTIAAGKSSIEAQQMKPKSSKNDAEVLNQISFIEGLVNTVSCESFRTNNQLITLSNQTIYFS
jgi:hypothetical protein